MKRQIRVIPRGSPLLGEILVARTIGDEFFSNPRLGGGYIIGEQIVDAPVSATTAKRRVSRRSTSMFAVPAFAEFNTEFFCDPAAKLAWLRRHYGIQA